MKKTVSALTLAGALAFAGAGAASAVDSSYPAPATGTVSAGVVAPGSSVVFAGTGFIPGESIRIDVTYANDPVVVAGTGVSSPIILAQRINSFTTTANADGTFSANVALGEEGTYTLTATGLTSGKVVVNTVVVDAAAAAGAGVGTGSPAGSGSNANAGQGGLASTGADSAMLLWGAAGVLALGAGVASVAVARRKNA